MVQIAMAKLQSMNLEQKTLNADFVESLISLILFELSDKGITQSTLSDFAGVGINTPAHFIKTRNCNIKNLVRMCDALNIKLSFEKLPGGIL